MLIVVATVAAVHYTIPLYLFYALIWFIRSKIKTQHFLAGLKQQTWSIFNLLNQNYWAVFSNNFKQQRSFQQMLLGQTGFLIFYIIFLSLSLSASIWNGDWRCSISVISAAAACNMICFYFIIFIPYEYRIPWLKLFFQSFNLKIWSLISCTHLKYKMLCVWCRELKLNTEHSAQQQQNVLLTIPWCLQQQQYSSRKSTWLLNVVVQ